MSAGFDPLIHPPARSQAMLAETSEVEFALLRSSLGVSDSVLSKHLGALAEAGYVALRKGASAGRSRTWVAATRAGRSAFRRHVAALQALVSVTERMAAE